MTITKRELQHLTNAKFKGYKWFDDNWHKLDEEKKFRWVCLCAGKDMADKIEQALSGELSSSFTVDQAEKLLKIAHELSTIRNINSNRLDNKLTYN